MTDRGFELTVTIGVSVIDATTLSDQVLADGLIDQIRESIGAAEYWVGPDDTLVVADVRGHRLGGPAWDGKTIPAWDDYPKGSLDHREEGE
jgi:hypothetical protein